MQICWTAEAWNPTIDLSLSYCHWFFDFEMVSLRTTLRIDLRLEKYTWILLIPVAVPWYPTLPAKKMAWIPCLRWMFMFLARFLLCYASFTSNYLIFNIPTHFRPVKPFMSTLICLFVIKLTTKFMLQNEHFLHEHWSHNNLVYDVLFFGQFLSS